VRCPAAAFKKFVWAALLVASRRVSAHVSVSRSRSHSRSHSHSRSLYKRPPPIFHGQQIQTRLSKKQKLLRHEELDTFFALKMVATIAAKIEQGRRKEDGADIFVYPAVESELANTRSGVCVCVCVCVCVRMRERESVRGSCACQQLW
jgi:hypothetical protein